MLVATRDDLRSRSTEAARAFVQHTRDRMLLERLRHGDEITATRAYERLVRGIEHDELRRNWPAADVDEALGSGRTEHPSTETADPRHEREADR